MKPKTAMKNLVFALLITLISLTHAGGVAGSPADKDRAIREEFVRKAMESEEWKRKEQEADLHRRGEWPLLTASPVISPFADWDYYYVRGTIVWEPNSGQRFRRVEVPDGFVTDLASIPRIFWQVLKPQGRHAYAAVVHDYLYWEQDRSREEADLIFMIAMQDSKVNRATVKLLYTAVRRFGKDAWEKNSELKRSGERRLLKRFPPDFKITWNEWKNQPQVFESAAPDEEVPPVRRNATN